MLLGGRFRGAAAAASSCLCLTLGSSTQKLPPPLPLLLLLLPLLLRLSVQKLPAVEPTASVSCSHSLGLDTCCGSFNRRCSDSRSDR